MQVNRNVIRIRLLFFGRGCSTRGKIVFKLWGYNEILFSSIARLLEFLPNFFTLNEKSTLRKKKGRKKRTKWKHGDFQM